MNNFKKNVKGKMVGTKSYILYNIYIKIENMLKLIYGARNQNCLQGGVGGNYFVGHMGFRFASKILSLDSVAIWADLLCDNCFCCTFMTSVLFHTYVTSILKIYIFSQNYLR